jgi:hypothetical protein
MHKESSNSDVYLLVLGRPADPFRVLLSAFLSRQHYRFSVCSSIYQVLVELESVSAGQQVVLMTRPAMLTPQATAFLARRFPTVRVIGWLDSNENLSTLAAVQALPHGMTMVRSCDQLYTRIQSLVSVRLQDFSAVPDTRRKEISDNLDPMEYELCDDEMNALLGVE